MHDVPSSEHWHEPQGRKNAGYGAWKRPNTPYDNFMEAQGVPIYRGIGVRRIQDLPLQPWARMGGRGTFIQLYGTEGKWGSYVVEVPGAGALKPERHMYEEIMVVAEGRGTTEIWIDGQVRPHTFEWQPGSMFSVPLNTWHRIVNAASTPALILVATSAPNVMNLFRDTDWIFNCPATFPSRFDGSADFFKPKDDIAPDPLRGLAMRKSNLIPDIVNGQLYLDNRRSPGYLRVEPAMAGNVFYGFVGEHETGRYSKAHAHLSSAVLVCLKGKGYTYTWPRTIGMTPWKDGKADQVFRQDYEHMGMVTAAPYGGDWFHAHFGISKEPLRLIGWYGPLNHRKDRAGVPGEKDTDEGAIDVTEGGTAIPYYLEDPFLRGEYEATLAKAGVKSRMEPALYAPPLTAKSA
ncbi:MAG TPA: cupin domain-containing protein [Micropepsaceae bacterium]|nr:cupin domain-containing protein [Micropepsaceae bacterium]